MTETQPDSRPPRGALIVVAVGLLACVVAALLSTGKGEGESSNLEWVQRTKLPDSAPADVPGGPGQMQLVDAEIKASGANVSGYELFLTGATLRIDAGSPIGRSHLLCTMVGKGHSEISRTSGGLRSLFPRSSESGISSQNEPDELPIDFSARGGEVVIVEAPIFRSFTTEYGVKLEWPKYQVGAEHLEYFITGKPKRDLQLPFYTIWKTTNVPAAAISCTLKTGAGKATVHTAGSLKHTSPPIDEEAEEHAEERAEEEEEEAEEEAVEGE